MLKLTTGSKSNPVTILINQDNIAYIFPEKARTFCPPTFSASSGVSGFEYLDSLYSVKSENYRQKYSQNGKEINFDEAQRVFSKWLVENQERLESNFNNLNYQNSQVIFLQKVGNKESVSVHETVEEIFSSLQYNKSH